MASVDMTRLTSNIAAMNSLKSLQDINSKLAVHQERLATGKRINNAGDDPAGLTIATKMLARSEGLKVALNNVGDAKNLIAVAESGMGRINDILVQMRNKAEQAASDTLGTEERSAIVTQLNSLTAQIDDIVEQTKWNGQKLLDGLEAFDGTLTFQTGADRGDTTKLTGLADMGAESLSLVKVAETSSATDATGDITLVTDVNVDADIAEADLASGEYTVKVTYGAAAADDATVSLWDSSNTQVGSDVFVDVESAVGTFDFGNGIDGSLAEHGTNDDVTGEVKFTLTSIGAKSLSSASMSAALTGASSAADFATFMHDVNSALNTVSSEMTKIGSLTASLTFKEDQIGAAQINTESAYNRIISANMAEEQVNASKYQILQQTATAMLAQANAGPQFLLSLFR